MVVWAVWRQTLWMPCQVSSLLETEMGFVTVTVCSAKPLWMATKWNTQMIGWRMTTFGKFAKTVKHKLYTTAVASTWLKRQKDCVRYTKAVLMFWLCLMIRGWLGPTMMSLIRFACGLLKCRKGCKSRFLNVVFWKVFQANCILMTRMKKVVACVCVKSTSSVQLVCKTLLSTTWQMGIHYIHCHSK